MHGTSYKVIVFKGEKRQGWVHVHFSPMKSQHHGRVQVKGISGTLVVSAVSVLAGNRQTLLIYMGGLTA